MREYELMTLVQPQLEEEQLAALSEKVNNFITNLGGEVKEVTSEAPWGRRRLAYPIKNYQEGIYTVSRINLEPDKTLTLERDLKLTEDILRYLLVKVGE